LLLATGLAGCTASGQKPAAATATLAPVVVTEVEPRDVPLFSEFAAQTYARNMVEVRGRVEGYIDQWLFRPGAEVKAGQTLYVLDLRPYQAAVGQARGNVHQSEADLEFARKQVALLQAEANLAAAQANLVKEQQDYDRLTPLVEQEAASKQDLDAATAALRAGEATVRAAQANVDQMRLQTQTQIASTSAKADAQRAALRTASLNLEYATIRAPISGLIGDTLVPVGGLVNANAQQPLTTIVPLDPIWVRFKASETQYLAFKKNPEPLRSPLTLILADNSNFPQKGRIENTLNQVDPKTGTLEMQASFPNPKHTLLPGQFGQVRVETEVRRNVLLIPQRAVQQLQNIQTVYTLSAADQVELRPISTAERSGEDWIVTQGLKPGDRVIVEGQLKVRPGMNVHPQPYRAPAAPSAARSES